MRGSRSRRRNSPATRTGEWLLYALARCFRWLRRPVPVWALADVAAPVGGALTLAVPVTGNDPLAMMTQVNRRIGAWIGARPEQWFWFHRRWRTGPRPDRREGSMAHDLPMGGRCLCGAVTYEYEGERLWSAYCHCESCRRNCSAPVTAFFGVARETFRWTGAMPTAYESSSGVRRHFCACCGTPMAYDADHDARNIHLYAASLDDPADYRPTAHVFAAERLPWFDTADDLKRFAGGGAGG